MNFTVRYSQKPLFEEPLNVGWYYGFNPDRKPLDSMFQVCKLLTCNLESSKCSVLVYGEGFVRDAYTGDFVRLIIRRECDIRGLTGVLSVSAEQLQMWEQRVKMVDIRKSRRSGRQRLSGVDTRLSIILP